MHILPGYYKFIWHITIRIIFPPKFSEWTTLQIYEVRGQELHCSASVTHQSCLTAIQRAGFTKIWAQDVFFLPVCWEFGKSSLLNKYVLAAKEAESNNVSVQRCLISVSGHLTIKPSRHQPLFWMLMDVKLFCQFCNLSNAKVYILQAYTCILGLLFALPRTEHIRCKDRQ